MFLFFTWYSVWERVFINSFYFYMHFIAIPLHAIIHVHLISNHLVFQFLHLILMGSVCLLAWIDFWVIYISNYYWQSITGLLVILHVIIYNYVRNLHKTTAYNSGMIYRTPKTSISSIYWYIHYEAITCSGITSQFQEQT